jgi:hypothetical protein
MHGCSPVVSLAWLPVTPSASWKLVGDEDPLPRILGLLATTVGLPYFVLSATTPLLQLWLTQRRNALPWRFYPVSNVASLVALLAYPLVIEPLMPTRLQALGWSALYAGFLALCGLVIGRRASITPVTVQATVHPPVADRLRWLVLSA